MNSEHSQEKNFPELSFAAWRWSNSQKVDSRPVHYWTYAPGENAEKWDEFYNKGIMAIGWGEIGDLMNFSSKDSIKAKFNEVWNDNSSHKNSVLATWQFVHEMQIGDVIYAKKGKNQLVGRGIVASDYFYDDTVTDEFRNIRKVDWEYCGEWVSSVIPATKTLTDVTAYSDFIRALDDSIGVVKWEKYTDSDFLREVFLTEQDFTRLKNLLNHKKNIILQGAPGVGKTYIAKRLAYAIPKVD